MRRLETEKHKELRKTREISMRNKDEANKEGEKVMRRNRKECKGKSEEGK